MVYCHQSENANKKINVKNGVSSQKSSSDIVLVLKRTMREQKETKITKGEGQAIAAPSCHSSFPSLASVKDHSRF
jgi:hypothetical protein